MFTKIFSKTALLGYFIAFAVLLLAVYSHHKAILINNPLEGSTFKLIVAGILSVISLIFVEWTVRRQLLFQTGSYHLLLFPLFFWILPINRWDIWLWIASLLLWLSFINIIKVDDKRNSNNFIFNAGFWLVFSIFFKVDFFYFYLTIWGMLYFKGQLSFKNIFITLLPVFFISIIWATLFILIPKFPSLQTVNVLPSNFSFLWSELYSDSLGLFLVIITTILIVLKHFRMLIYSRNSQKINFYNTTLILFSSIIIILFGGSGNMISWVSFLMVTSILSTQYFKSFNRKWLVELFFFTCFLVVFQNEITSILF
tara:strand:- start:6717 stop:7652 length:936 start_codon:yes stop_codon:yes gene_type:complete